MQLEMVILSEVDQIKTNTIWYHLHVEFKKNDMNEFIYKIKTKSKTSKSNLWLPEGKWGGIN